MFLGASHEQIHCIVEKHGLLESLAHIITNFDDMEQQTLEAILNVLGVGECYFQINYTKYIEEAGLVEIIKGLAMKNQFSKNANRILKYFPIEMEEESKEVKTKMIKEFNEN